MARPLIRLLSGLLFLAATSPLPAHFAPPRDIPVKRLLANAERYITEHPQDADGHYTVARIHYLAFAIGRDNIPGYEGDHKSPDPKATLDRADGRVNIDYERNSRHKGRSLSPAQMVEHAGAAKREFGEAIQRAPRNGYYRLGLGSFLEEFLRWKGTAPPMTIPEELAAINAKTARAAYGKAFEVAWPEDSKIKILGPDGLSEIVSHESATGFLRLSANAPLDTPEKRLRARMEAALAQLKKINFGAITPIVFSLLPAARLEELLAPDREVEFDLRGYGVPERWPWIKPELGLLVWDPSRTGEITSGRQLFGSYTFQLFWKDGYHALAALDDNGDGELSGDELHGVAVWFDRNSDGVSEAGEIKSLAELGVVAIACNASGKDGPHPTNASGVRLRDGRTLQTWDWMVAPVKAPLSLSKR